NCQQDNDAARQPIRRAEHRQHCARHLHQQPCADQIQPRETNDIALLQLGKEVVDLHFFSSAFGPTTFCTSASKRGSPCKESSSGSTLITPISSPSRSA